MTVLRSMSRWFCLVVVLFVSVPGASARSANPLASWNDSAAQARGLAFVTGVSTEGSSDYVAPSDRIAVFSHEGPLWAEQPAYFQLMFALDRVRALSAKRPEWKALEPFASMLRGDFEQTVDAWIATAFDQR